jgi:chromatin structure-remodeling complex subunit RSC9
VSDTKGNKLAWRKIATDFLPGNANVVQLAFQVKTAYYKNLAFVLSPSLLVLIRMCIDVIRAYEISTFHKKQPPPKEILEDLTAKGGDLLNRTIENYTPRVSREAENLVNGDDDSDMEQKTPGQDKMDVDEPGSTGGRVTRGKSQSTSAV